MVFEAKVDNQVHGEMLKKGDDITPDNYLYALFGPDTDIISYDFEAIATEDISETEL